MQHHQTSVFKINIINTCIRLLEHIHMAWKWHFNILAQCYNQNRCVKTLPIVGHRYDKGNTSWINLSLLVQLVFHKSDELFPKPQKILTICTSLFEIPANCVIFWGILTGGSHQKVHFFIVYTIPVRWKTSKENLIVWF